MAPEQLQGETATPAPTSSRSASCSTSTRRGVHPVRGGEPRWRWRPHPRERAEAPLSQHAGPDVPPSLPTVSIDACRRHRPIGSPTARNRARAGVHDRVAATAPVPAAVDLLVANTPARAIALYFIACVLLWQIKEWQPGVTTALFVAVRRQHGGGVFSGHLLFTERVNDPGLTAERRRATGHAAGGSGCWRRPGAAGALCRLDARPGRSDHRARRRHRPRQARRRARHAPPRFSKLQTGAAG